MHIKEVIKSAEQQSVELKQQAAKKAKLSAQKAAARLKISKAQMQLQNLNRA